MVTDFIKGEEGTYYLAGPLAMLKEFSRKFMVKAYASVEERMGCGFGVCMGCGIMLKDGSYKRVCTDGPVFELERIEWED